MLKLTILTNSSSYTYEKFPIINILISYCSSKIRSQITIEKQLAGVKDRQVATDS